MDQPPIFFVDGLPRSGNTLLMNLLGQNPRHHVTPSNGVVDLLVALRDMWPELPGFKSQGLEVMKPRITAAFKGLLEGFYRQELDDGKIVFDRSRGWLAYAELMEEVLGRPLHILVMLRDMRAIIASYEKLHRLNPLTSPRAASYNLGQTIAGRAQILLAEDGVVGLAVARLRDALRRGTKSQIIFLPYNALSRNPVSVLSQLHQKLGLSPFKYDPNDLKQLTREEELMSGMTRGHFRTKVEAGNETPWVGVLPDDLCARLMTDYADIQKYSGGV